MSAIIGADAAKLAGLQIDLLQKYRAGHITDEHIEWFAGLRKDERDAFMTKRKKSVSLVQPEKFSLLADLGIMALPEDYVSESRLTSFKAKYQNDETKSFFYYDDAITDENFPNPSRILKPGDRLWVRAFQQVSEGTTTSVERMAFLDTQKAIHTGAQGASLVWEQKRDQLPKGKWYTSFDEEERLWQDTVGSHGVPCVVAYSGGDFYFCLGSFGDVWRGDRAFFCFCDLPA